MSGREFGIQSSWDDIFKKLVPELDIKSRRQATSIAEGLNQQIEEFINRYGVTALNDNGDLTFEGNITVQGDLTLNDENATIFVDSTANPGTLGYISGSASATLVLQSPIASGDTSSSQLVLYSGTGTEADWPYVSVTGAFSVNAEVYTQDKIFFALRGNEDSYLDFSGFGWRWYVDSGGTGVEEFRMDTNGYFHAGGNRLYMGIGSNDYIDFDETLNEWKFVSDNVERLRIDVSELASAGEYLYMNGIGGNTYFRVNDSSSYFMIILNGSNWAEFDDPNPDGGNYGTLHFRDGVGDGGYEGINVLGDFACMTNGTAAGLYDDTDNMWLIQTGGPGSTDDANWAFHTIRADASDGDLDYHYMFFTPDSDTGGGSAGTGYNHLNDEIGGFSGTAAHVTTTTLNGVTGKRLGFSSSTDEGKTNKLDDPIMSTEAFMRIRPISFMPNDQYVDDIGRHHFWDPWRAIDSDFSEHDPPPESWIPLKRFGFSWDYMAEDEEQWPLITDMGIDQNGVLAALVGQVQQLIKRVEQLEAAV